MRQSWDQTWMHVAEVIAGRSVCDGRAIGAIVVDSSNRPVSTGYNGPPRGFQRSSDHCSDWCPRQQTRTVTVKKMVARKVVEQEVTIPGPGPSYGLNCPSIHAEANALMFADRRDFEGGTIYVTSACCADCGKLIANSGLKRVVMKLDEVADAHRKPRETVAFLESCQLIVDLW